MQREISGRATRRLMSLGVASAVAALAGAAALVFVVARGWQDVVMGLVLLLSGLVTVLLADLAMRAQISDTTDAAADGVRRQLEEQRTELLAQTRRENIRRVHDTLLHLFQQIASGRGKLTRDEVKRLTEESRAGIIGAEPDPDSSPLVASLEEALSRVGCPVELKVNDRGALPGRVTRVMSEATREAARNVARHVPNGTAHVQATSSSDGCIITISDWGPGFDTDEVPRARMGIRDGIHGRMLEIGGQADIRSDVSGTEVTLTWKPLPHATRIGPAGRRFLALTPFPAIVASVIMLVLTPPASTLFVAGPMLLATAGLLLLIRLILQRRGLRAREAIVAVCWGMLVLVINHGLASLAPDGAQLWVAPMAGALMLVALPGRNGRLVTLLMSGMVLVATIGSLGWLGGYRPPLGLGALIPTLVWALITLGVVLVMSVLSQRAHQAAEQRAELLMSEELRVARITEQQLWLRELERICGPLFTELHTGKADPADPAVRVEARHAESRLRDALRMWPDGMRLAAALDVLRRAGWGCMLDIEQIEETEAIRLADILRGLGDPETGQRLTITRRKGTLMVTIAEPGLTIGQQSLLTGARILVTDPDFTQLVCEEERR
ncbi:hypothetical protein EII34_10185 [Arachnia propionica]|uniref:Uncharacterized protein n=1 Tax=Arachnia propionica TaxID=1750 RepID=A0A3P1T4I6_9ACTN|nr:hypothetical protein [Arachnia propionica]MDO5082912.1 hypothetical protein [Arachnia propionica]RRD04422.1 hypothetical protein EII34_10185 [Arachnia propionica]